ncbi:ArsR/SmtB family transcription factor [Methanosphaera sp.]
MEKVDEKKTDEEIKTTFKLLSNQNRLKIIQILAQNNQEVTVNEIAEKINITQPAASQHLKLLKKEKIVKCDKKGNNIYYKINTETLKKRKKCIDTLFHNILE